MVVSVEPDPSVHPLLLANRRANNCNFAVVQGTVASPPLVTKPFFDYGTGTIKPKPGQAKTMFT